jgi:hypothetical protein
MDIFEGRITSCGFDSGDRIVIGLWEKSPFGSFADIMWARPDGTKILIAPNEKIGEYIDSLYEFDEIRIEEIKIQRNRKEIIFNCTDIQCQFNWGNEISFLVKRRPLWFVSTIEYFFGWLIFRTKTHGKTKNGRKEWYVVDKISRLKKAKAKISGKDLGRYTKFSPKANFGFSDPPKMPASVIVRSHIE